MADTFKVDLPSLSTPRGPTKTTITADSTPVREKSFGKTLETFLGDVNETHEAADKTIENVVTGRTEHLHEAVVAINKAEMSFRYMMEVRSKLLQAYQEVQRIQM